MSRDLHALTESALLGATLFPALLLRLDIKDDPIYVWTGPYDYSPSGTGDASLDGLTFLLGGHVAEFSSITDSADGSQPVSITLPGIDPDSSALKEIIWDSRLWQFRPAFIWLALLDEDSQIIGKPIRIKTGRIDNIEYQGLETEARLICTIEGFNAWASEPLNSKWSHQKQFDATDISNDFTATLANTQPTLGSVGSSFPVVSGGATSAISSNNVRF